ncbi:MAG: lipid A deacylase LpxR family protein [Planctomycetes bacterium]|nr:lipid A deacylase LpxR family protein [Planctomycetota bacterium]
MEVGDFDRRDGRTILKRGILFFMLFVILSGYGFAKDAISLYLENDSRRFKPNHATDRHYTHGTKFVYLTQPNWQWLEDFSQWHFADANQPVDTAVGFFLGQNIYTSDHVDKPARRSDKDMVFAGWLYTGMFAQRATDHLLDHLELSIGVIGPSSKAEQFQKALHDAIGWDDQLGDELAVDLSFMRKQRLQSGWFKPTEHTDFIAEYGFTVGSVHRHLQAGVTFRYGFNLANTFGPARMALPSGISTLRKDETAQSVYLFARASGKAIEHNRFLTGLKAEPLMAEFQVGIVHQFKKVELGYSQTFFTQEFEEQSGKDSFGAFTLSWKF